MTNNMTHFYFNNNYIYGENLEEDYYYALFINDEISQVLHIDHSTSDIDVNTYDTASILKTSDYECLYQTYNVNEQSHISDFIKNCDVEYLGDMICPNGEIYGQNLPLWKIGNEKVESLSIENKEIILIKKISHGVILYKKNGYDNIITIMQHTGNQIKLGYSTYNWINNNGDVVVDWGDGTIDIVNNPNREMTHNYTDGETNHEIMFLGEVTNIGRSCFEGSTGLTNIAISNNVTSIGEKCFNICTNLTRVVIPNSVTSIGDRCFYPAINLIDYQLYWTGEDIIPFSNANLANNSNTVFTIPYGETSNYIAKGYPSNKLTERMIPHSITVSSTKDTLSFSHSQSTVLTATVLDEDNNPCSNKEIIFKTGSTVLNVTTTDNNGQATCTYESAGVGEARIIIGCESISTRYIINDYLFVPPLDGTDAITKWTNMTNTTSNGVFQSHGSYLSNGWDNSGLWQLDFDVRTSNWYYVGLMPVCAPGINPFTDAKNDTYSLTCWEGFTVPSGMGFTDVSGTSFNKRRDTNTTFHMTIQKISSNRIKIILLNNENLVWVKESSRLANYPILHFGSRDNPSSRNSGGILEFSNIVVKPINL